MENDIRGAGQAFDRQLTARWMKKGQQFGGSSAAIFMRLLGGMTCHLPTCAWGGFGLVGSCFILTAHAQSKQVGDEVGLFY